MIELHICAKFQVHTNFGSRDMGQKGVKNGGFRYYFENTQSILVHSLRDTRYYSVSYACKVSSPYQFWFLRYGAKGGQNWGFSGVSQNISLRFGSFS